ncbi:wall-associated protein [Luteimonas granuli]|uniref:wall-associated protein n=1 Tax=Luteimonas granuli TaxID=1176533 RepID=UPI001AF0149C|nr:wall-associated protein [Luteimonas granuli]
MIEYHDNATLWVVGQARRTTCVASTPAHWACDGGSDSVISETTYDSGYALPLASKQFGKVVQALEWDTVSSVASGQRGTVRSVVDGNNNVITATSWKRGAPRNIRYPGTPEAPSGAVRSATVNDHGWITAISDEAGSRTCYDYDVMGRITTVTYPSESSANVCDTSSWTATTASFGRSGAAQYGLPAGHWQQSVSTGANRKVIYFDALWRPVVSERFDSGNAVITRSATVQRYDAAGRLVFQSYPVSDPGHYASASLQGTHTTYDSLSRVIRTAQDWEGTGQLVTSTDYLAGFQTQVTPPRGAAARTTVAYLAWEQPTTDYPVSIAHPAGAYTDIARDAFGKPMALVRRNASGSTALARNYVYDAYQQLCKSVEPETGATIMAYDGAGNLAWSMAGATQTGIFACNTEDIPAGQRTIRTYDARNRLQTLMFPDGRGNQAWTYTGTGLPSTITTNNSDGGDVVSNIYAYNRRGLPVGETFSVGTQLWSIGYDYNQLGHLRSHITPGLIVDYAPNALGQPTQAGTYATAVVHHPDGAIQQFTYGNGIRHVLTQNGRGLPDTRCDFIGGGCTANAVLRDGYDYDQHGNLLAISDGRTGNRGDRSMSYDALDRLTQVVSPMFGTANYGYDVLDNLTSVQVTGGSRARNHGYVYDASNRLTNVTNTVGGPTVIGLGYDARGNLANRNGVLHAFDHGNRLRELSGESYRYDGHGRRVLAVRNGQNLYSLYGQDGVLRFQRDERTGKTIDYVHLGGRLVAQVENAVPLATPSLFVPGSSPTGSYTVSWSVSPIASKYELQERLGSGSWTTIHDGTGTSKAVSGRAAGVWGYRVRACSATTCGTWSPISSVTVQLAPTSAPTLNVPSVAHNGNFPVSWTGVAAATSYQLQERSGTGSWSTVHDAAATSTSVSGKAAGSWGYQVRACNAAGCGVWSSIATVQVIHSPSSAPVLAVPGASITGDYTVSWNSVTSSTRYELEEQLNDGGWTPIHNAAATAKAVSGKATGAWAYRVRACNDAGCSTWSATAVVSVTRPPTSTPTLTAPATNTTGSYLVTWTAVTHATGYQLQERPGAGSWTTIHDAAGTSVAISGKVGGESWSYQVRACNIAGCGAWSPVATVAVTMSAPTVPVLVLPATSPGSYTASWTSAPGATGYQLQERVLPGPWSTVYDGPATSRSFTKPYGIYRYQLRACNAAGCSAWTAESIIVVEPGGGDCPVHPCDIEPSPGGR